MASIIDLSLQPREGTGKGVARKLRAEDRMPVVLYGAGREPRTFSVSRVDLRQAISTDYGTRILLRLNVEGEKGEATHAILKAVQKHPVRHDMLHADLLAVDKDRPVIMRVPVLAAPGTPFGVKNQGGVLEWMRRDVVLRILPEKIPARIELDVTGLRLGQSIKAGEVAGEDYQLAMSADEPICHVIATRMSLEVEEPEEEEGEAAEGAEGEGEGAEGEEAEASGEESKE